MAHVTKPFRRGRRPYKIYGVDKSLHAAIASRAFHVGAACGGPDAYQRYTIGCFYISSCLLPRGVARDISLPLHWHSSTVSCIKLVGFGCLKFDPSLICHQLGLHKIFKGPLLTVSSQTLSFVSLFWKEVPYGALRRVP
ncbi:hypothetical protein EVAR_59467_1 [Eumeta japonica]|uniref:Uncharacterized protein n=1 Tax=Eumeta variegata TaxID=151549 RepID=A0A4C1Z195_EUMVA|nr:hypothetical protein EVAR_59467_1 [Eumeta japonica]